MRSPAPSPVPRCMRRPAVTWRPRHPRCRAIHSGSAWRRESRAPTACRSGPGSRPSRSRRTAACPRRACRCAGEVATDDGLLERGGVRHGRRAAGSGPLRACRRRGLEPRAATTTTGSSPAARRARSGARRPRPSRATSDELALRLRVAARRGPTATTPPTGAWRSEDLDLVDPPRRLHLRVRHRRERRQPQRPGAEQLRQDCKTLDRYRLQHALYKTDPDLQRAHRALPLGGHLGRPRGPERLRGHRPRVRRDRARRSCAQRAAAYQAYYEHMPVQRQGAGPTRATSGSTGACATATSSSSTCSTLASTATTSPAATASSSAATRTSTATKLGRRAEPLAAATARATRRRAGTCSRRAR